MPLLAALPTGAQEDAFPEITVDLTFPLSGGEWSYVDSYYAARSGGRVHWATDIMADKLVHAHAAVDGEVCKLTGVDEPMPSWGYALTVCGDDGLQYTYIHINNDTPGTDDGAGGPEWAYAPAVLEGGEGMRVARGQWIAYVGDSGNAESTGAHLHFELRNPELASTNDGRYNPYPSLQSAEERGDIPPVPEDPNLGSDGAPPPPAPPEPEPSEEPEPTEPAPSEPAQPHRVATERLAGDTRLETAVQLSRASFDAANVVIVVPSDSFAEALTSAPLAGFLDAPVLLSGPDGLSEAALAEVTRLRPMSAYLVGTEAQLGAGVADDLTAAGVQFLGRLAGADRFELGALVARDIDSYPQQGTGFDEVVLALGESEDDSRAWPDALSVSALAAHRVTPILLTRGDALPGVVADFLAEFTPSNIVVVGGTAAISDAVAAAAADAAGGADITRLAGVTRYDTSAVIADVAVDAGLDDRTVWVATGRNYPDALAAGPAAAAAGAPLLLIDGLDPAGSPESSSWLHAYGANGLKVVGGAGAISDAVVEASAETAAP